MHALVKAYEAVEYDEDTPEIAVGWAVMENVAYEVPAGKHEPATAVIGVVPVATVEAPVVPNMFDPTNKLLLQVGVVEPGVIV